MKNAKWAITLKLLEMAYLLIRCDFVAQQVLFYI